MEPLRRRAVHPLGPVESVHQVAGDAVFLLHHRDGLGRVKGRVALAAALRVGHERLLELIGEAEVVHHETARLVPEDAVHASDRLHQAMALHRLVRIHRVQTGRVEAREPHVAHDHNLEGILRVFEAVRQIAALLFRAEVLLPRATILRAARHQDFERFRLPLGTQDITRPTVFAE